MADLNDPAGTTSASAKEAHDRKHQKRMMKQYFKDTMVNEDIYSDFCVIPIRTLGGERGHARGVRELAYSENCLLYTSPSPRDRTRSRMPSSA